MSALRSSYRCLFCLLALVCLTVPVQPAHAESGEYQVKTAMIYNMIRFMDWPEDALPASASQFTICVMGRGGLSAEVDSLRGKQVKGKTVVVRQSSPATGASGCQVMVLGDLDKITTSALLEKTRSSVVVTVADSPGFARSGGTVGFVLQHGKVRFEINQAAAQRHRIRISAQLLKLAQIVQESP
jgi:hypothetical protein